MPVATPLPVGTPRAGFWDRVLGRNREASTERQATSPKADKTASKATPEPKPTAKKPATAAAAKPTATAGTESTPPKPASPPRPTASSRPPASRSALAPALAPGEDGVSEAEERTKFAEAKTKALESTALQELKLKADTAPTEEEARRSLRAYNKALFLRMRQIDPSIRERIDATEAFILKRLGE
jgi:hypothetical protein